LVKVNVPGTAFSLSDGIHHTPKNTKASIIFLVKLILVIRTDESKKSNERLKKIEDVFTQPFMT
jgi:hypothetical protein